MHPLLSEAAQGSLPAQQQLVERFTADLRQYIDRKMWRRLKRHVSAADLSQETFVQVFRSLASLPEDATLDTFKGRLFKNASWLIARRSEAAGHFHGESALGSEFKLERLEQREMS